MNPKEEVSVKQALERGRNMLNVPSSIVPKVIIGIMILLALLKIIAWQYALFSVPLSLFLFPLFYRSYRVKKWKLWAYENTRNVNELRGKAIMQGIISEDDGFLEKLFRTSAEEKKLEELQKKFQISDLFIDQPQVPEETVFYYSKRENLFAVLFFSIGALLSLYYFLKTQDIFSLLLLIVAICFIVMNLLKPPKNERYLILNEKGIETFNRSLTSWSEIFGEKIIRGKGDDSNDFYLIFRVGPVEEIIGIDRLEVKPAELLDLMKIYRGRFEAKNALTAE